MEGEEGADKRLKFCNTVRKSENKIKWRDRKAEIHLEEGRLRNGVAIVLEQKHLYWYLD